MAEDIVLMRFREQITDVLCGPLEQEGYEIVELRLSHYKGNHRIQVFLDSDNGVGLDDCARLSKLIGDILEEKELFSSKYILEVSSPGLDRPLTTSKDFRRRIGEKIQLFFNDAEISSVSGELINANERYIELLMEDGSKKYEHVDIRMGKIIF